MRNEFPKRQKTMEESKMNEDENNIAKRFPAIIVNIVPVLEYGLISLFRFWYSFPRIRHPSFIHSHA